MKERVPTHLTKKKRMAMQTIVFVYQGSAIRRRRGALHVQKRGGGLALTRDNQLVNLEDARERKRHAAP